MRITELHIAGFGKLQDYSLCFADGFNLIYGDNEKGKTTLLAFIKAMLYGFESRGKKKVAENEFLHYMPWNGGNMGGTLSFTYRDNEYILERTFGKTKSSDKQRLFNRTTGEEVALEKSCVGEQLFGIPPETFEQTVFISQSGGVIAEDQKNNDIVTKLANLISSGEEEVSVQQVEQRLKNAINKIQGTGRNTVLKSLEQECEQLRSEYIEAISKEEQLSQNQKRLAELDAQIDCLKQRAAKQEAAKRTQELDRIIDLQRQVEKGQEDLDALAQMMQAGDVCLDQSYCTGLRSEYDTLKTKKDYLLRQNTELQQIEEKCEVLFQKTKQFTDQAELSHVTALQEELAELQRQQAGQQKLFADLSEQLLVLGAARETELQRQKERVHQAQLSVAKAKEEWTRLQNQKISIANQAAVRRTALQEKLNYIEETLEKNQKQAQELSAAAETLKAGRLVLEKAQEKARQSYEQASGQWEYAKKQQPAANPPLQGGDGKNKKGSKALFFSGLAAIVSFVVLGAAISPVLFAGMAAGFLLLILAFQRVGQPPAQSQEPPRGMAGQERLEREKAHALEQIHLIQKDIHAKDHAIAENAQQIEKILAETAEAAEEERILKQQLAALNSEGSEEEVDALLQQAKHQQEQKEREQHLQEQELQKLRNAAATLSTDEKRIQQQQEACGRQLKKLEAGADVLKQQLSQILQFADCKDINEFQAWVLKGKEQQQEYKAMCIQREQKQNQLEAAEAADRAEEQRFIEKLNRFAGIGTWEQAGEALGQLEQRVAAWNAARSEVEQKKAAFAASLDGMDYHALLAERASLPEEGAVDIIEEDLLASLAQVQQERAQLEGEINARQDSAVSSEEIALRIRQVEQKREQAMYYAQCLTLAQEGVQQSFEQLQRNFGPLINEETAAILSGITGGRYTAVDVSKTLDVYVHDHTSAGRQWSYMSSGTVEQIYFALRLAIAHLVVHQGEDFFPVLLDDIFDRYDDTRAGRAMEYLIRQHSGQVLLFTCHKHFIQFAPQQNIIEL